MHAVVSTSNLDLQEYAAVSTLKPHLQMHAAMSTSKSHLQHQTDVLRQIASVLVGSESIHRLQALMALTLAIRAYIADLAPTTTTR